MISLLCYVKDKYNPQRVQHYLLNFVQEYMWNVLLQFSNFFKKPCFYQLVKNENLKNVENY